MPPTPGSTIVRNWITAAIDFVAFLTFILAMGLLIIGVSV